mmetsp:Transcript_13571/g.33359  ORF Transcript_13571/g.33359 Transcript_13571/m.33359 type:complete len:389 (-) Transcript_13571:570-1736(-)
MLYISFVEIFYKAVGGFEEAQLERLAIVPVGATEHSDAQKEFAAKQATWRAYVTFLAGVVLMMVLDKAVERLAPDAHGCQHAVAEAERSGCEGRSEKGVLAGAAGGPATAAPREDEKAEAAPTSSQDVVETERIAVEVNVEGDAHRAAVPAAAESTSDGGLATGSSANVGLQASVAVNKSKTSSGGSTSPATGGAFELDVSSSPLKEHQDVPGRISETDSEEEKLKEKQLSSMALKTALAIALHNFPEGLATFIATLDSVEVGAAMAFGIAIHNIPEGLCVSIPLYYSSKGDRHRAFLFGVASGLSEPLAALFCWAVLGSLASVDGNVYGVLFGLVAGMMVYISLHELLPTAIRYDPQDSVVTKSWLCGAAIIGLSLIVLLPDGSETA